MYKKLFLIFLTLLLITPICATNYNINIDDEYLATSIEQGVTINLTDIQKYKTNYSDDNHAIDIYLDGEMGGTVIEDKENNAGHIDLDKNLCSGNHELILVYYGASEYEDEQRYNFTIMEDRYYAIAPNNTITNNPALVRFSNYDYENFTHIILIDDELESALVKLCNICFLPSDIGIGEHTLQIVSFSNFNSFIYTQQYKFIINENNEVAVDLDSYETCVDNSLTSADIQSLKLEI